MADRDPKTLVAAEGTAMYELIRELFPIRRSLTGDGVRATLATIGRHIPLNVHEVPTGTTAFDWTVPREWNIRDAYIVGPHGQRVVDLAESSLHVVGYSTAIHRRMTLSELRPHLHTLPDHPDWIPYRTSYYQESWGFCISHRQMESLKDGEYEVFIDSTLEPGSLTYAECLIPGEVEDEVLISAHVCHPSLANDNLSGIAVATFIAAELLDRPRHFTYRMLFIPGTLGSLTWLSHNEERLSRIKHGLVLAGVGDSGHPTYKRSRHETSEIDQAMDQVLRERGRPYEVRPFSPWGYDERQFNSPGIGLPVGLFMRTPHGTYPEYHTSADDLAFVDPGSLSDSLAIIRTVMSLLDQNRAYRNLSPKGEPQLGKRGLYGAIGGASGRPDQLAMLWVLNQSDGSNSLLDIAQRSGLSFELIRVAADALSSAGLLAPAQSDPAKA
jgi:aminopeptidase-like protein